jgi:adenylate kinase family enzyme
MFQRICVVGTTGSGKSTLAKRISEKLELTFVELDALYWEAGWVGAPQEVFIARAEAATRGEKWVCAGNYSKVRDITWRRAQAVIWLDYPFPIIFWQLLRRTIRRALTREVLWNGNVEPFWPHLKLWSEESLFNWQIKTYAQHKREYPEQFGLPEHAHLEVIQLRTPGEAERWLSEIEG